MELNVELLTRRQALNPFARLGASFGLLNRPVCNDLNVLNDWNVWNGAIPMPNGAPVLSEAKLKESG